MNAVQITFREFRKAHDLSQARLAKKMGVSTRTVERWEAGTHSPSIQVMEHLGLLGKYLAEK